MVWFRASSEIGYRPEATQRDIGFHCHESRIAGIKTFHVRGVVGSFELDRVGLRLQSQSYNHQLELRHDDRGTYDEELQAYLAFKSLNVKNGSLLSIISRFFWPSGFRSCRPCATALCHAFQMLAGARDHAPKSVRSTRRASMVCCGFDFSSNPQ